MLKWIFGGLILLSFLIGSINGNMQNISNSILLEAGNAITLCLTLTGGICLWSGIVQIAQKSGLTTKISNLFAPIIRVIFKNIKASSKAIEFITMNIVANLLGLGNAATPLGLKAIEELKKDENLDNIATDNMILFLLINTSSLQLIPTTVGVLRLKYGSSSPFDIIPVCLASSVLTLAFVLILAKTLNKLFPIKRKECL